jgi:hypothetical protein
MDEPSVLEREILAHIDGIDKEISKLKSERLKAERMLFRARRDRQGLKDINRKNSLDRVIIENRIVQILTLEKTHMSIKQIYKDVLMMDSTVKESTFRSHIHRLSEKGLIKNSGIRGYWKKVIIDT